MFSFRKLEILFQVQIIWGWSACAICAIACVFYPSQMAAKGAVYNAADAALYAAVSPIIWSLALSWCILSSCTGHAGSSF